MPGSGPKRQSVIVHRPWQIRTGGDISLSLSPSPPRHRSETGSGMSTHAPPFVITQYYRCLKPSCPATKCFATALLFFPFAVSPAPPLCTHTYSYTLKYPRNCIIERHSRSPMDHHKAHNPSHFVSFCFPPSAQEIIMDFIFPFSSCFPLSWSTPQANDHQACPRSNTCWSTGLRAAANQLEWWIWSAW